MTEPETLWIPEADVVALLDLGEAIDALEEGLELEARGEARNMIKTQVLWGDGNTLHAIGATADGAGLVGTKTWAHTTGGATPLLILWDSGSGSLKAIVEAFALGQMRTGAMSGVATRWLAREDADTLAIIGTGKQALTQLAAVAAVRPLREVRAFSPTAANRETFAARVRNEDFGVPLQLTSTLEEAVENASIVTLVTRAREPFLAAALVAAGSHINAVGAISPERAELCQDIFARCTQVAADSVPAVRMLSREFGDYYENGPGDWQDVKAMSAIVAGGIKRPGGADLTLFKAMGMGISDLALGMRIYERAVAVGKGRRIPHPQRARPRLIA